MFARNTKAQGGGIATLILFISIILVAAIASFVLLDTGSTLQNRALTVGKESTIAVATHIDVDSIYGVDSDRDKQDIDTVILTIRLSPGSEPIDLSKVIIQLATDDLLINKISLNATPEDGPGGANVEADFTYKTVNGNDDVLIEAGETFELTYVIEDGTDAQPITARTRATFVLRTPYGSSSSIEFITPSQITKKFARLYP